MRSRASGGICGDSSAAPSAATMSSLRRRAIWVQRARSIARSSTGGRASARTTAPASPGSTSSRSHASRSRTSARWKNAAAPASRCGTARSSSATADRLALVADRAHEHADVLGRDALARDQPLDVGRHRLRLRALVVAAPERDLAAGRAAWSSFGDAVRRRLGDRAGRVDDPLRAAEALLEPHDRRRRPLGLEVAQVLRRRAAEAVDRLVVVARRADLAVLARQQPQQQALGEVRVLQLVDEHVAEAAVTTRARTCGLRPQQAERVEHEVAEVARAGLLQPAVVGGVDGGELALAVGLSGRASPPTRRSPRARRARP